MGQLNKGKKPLGMAVFLSILLLVLANGFVGRARPVGNEERGVFGGPIGPAAMAAVDPILEATTYGKNPIVVGGFPWNDSDSRLADQDLFAASLVDEGEAIGPIFSRDNLITYKVARGDTLSGIAAYFGISLSTIANANPSVRAKFLRPGDELHILPTSGIVYQTRDGDSLESISDYFNIPQEKIVQFNKSININTLGAGISLVIPGAKIGFVGSKNSLPNFDGNFRMPTEGFNWKILHHYNAVDIANSCGTPIFSAAEGLVVPDESFGDGRGADCKAVWNGGYGCFVLLEHPFGDGVRTRYAHLSKILVDVGNYIKQGEEIGTMGDSGDASGCHLHFEVYGAENPFAK